jgi:uncharacterized protein YceK
LRHELRRPQRDGYYPAVAVGAVEPSDGRAGSRASGAPTPEHATARDIRIQAAIDLGSALVLCMLLWPFPLARAALPPVVHVAAILIAWCVVHVLYLSIGLAAWSQTGGMRLVGLVLRSPEGEPCDRRQRVRWGLLAGLLVALRFVAPAGASARPTLVDRLGGAELFRE